VGSIMDDVVDEKSGAANAHSAGQRNPTSAFRARRSALLDVMFELPSRRDVTKCVITKETISQGNRPTLVTSGGSFEEPDEPVEQTA
jgi:ATP-dependent Clp protease ATP-binding subunit ClpX